MDGNFVFKQHICVKKSVCALQWQPGRWQVLGRCNALPEAVQSSVCYPGGSSCFWLHKSLLWDGRNKSLPLSCLQIISVQRIYRAIFLLCSPEDKAKFESESSSSSSLILNTWVSTFISKPFSGMFNSSSEKTRLSQAFISAKLR